MPRTWRIITPENVPLELELANPLARGAALAVDTAAVALLAIPVAALLTTLSGTGPVRVLFGVELGAAERFFLLYAFAFPLLILAYHTLLEGLWGGQTLGKRLFRLRVIRTDGTVPDLAAAFIRNALRLVDYLPCTCGVGFTVMLLSAHFQRLGDYAAGTMVVAEGLSAPPTPAPEEELLPEEVQVLTPLAVANLSRLSAEQVLALRYFLLRAPQLSEEQRQSLAAELAHKVAIVLWDGAPPENLPAEKLLREVVWLYQQRLR